MKKLLIITVILVLLPIRFGWGQETKRVYGLNEPRPTGYWVEWIEELYFRDTLSLGYYRNVPDTHWIYSVEWKPVLDSSWKQTTDTANFGLLITRTSKIDSIWEFEYIPDSSWVIDTVGWERK